MDNDDTAEEEEWSFIVVSVLLGGVSSPMNEYIVALFSTVRWSRSYERHPKPSSQQSNIAITFPFAI